MMAVNKSHDPLNYEGHDCGPSEPFSLPAGFFFSRPEFPGMSTVLCA